jgi:U3 small nucleolar RNA-associated protein 22
MAPTTAVLTPGVAVLGRVHHPYSEKFEVKVGAPDRVSVVGSYLLGSGAKPVCNVDLAVQLPKSLLLNKDYLNHKYARLSRRYEK